MTIIEFANYWMEQNRSAINPTEKLIITDLIKELDNQFAITIDEARALNYLLKLHNGLMKESEPHYTHILRLINGLGTFLDNQEKHDIRPVP